jgi:hypothetical protein
VKISTLSRSPSCCYSCANSGLPSAQLRSGFRNSRAEWRAANPNLCSQSVTLAHCKCSPTVQSESVIAPRGNPSQSRLLILGGGFPIPEPPVTRGLAFAAVAMGAQACPPKFVASCYGRAHGPASSLGA